MRFFCFALLLLAPISVMPTRAQPQGDTKSDTFVAVAKSFVDLLATEDFNKAVELYDATMKTALPREKLQQTWKAVISQTGGFKRNLDVVTQSLGGYQIVIVTCEFEKSKLNIKVVLDQEKRVAGLFFEPVHAEYSAPSYVKSSAFTEQEVTIGNGEWALSGTLTIPKGNGPWPAVVLVHGSGPHDRDETIGPNKPFRDLAGGLATNGIAVLRYEKRTFQHGKQFGYVKRLTVNEETIDDVVSAVELFRRHPAIVPRRVFVLGHSLGGTLVPRIASRDARIAGFIVMAGAASPIEDLILEQMNYIFMLDGTLSKDEQARIDNAARQITSIKNLKAADIDSDVLFLGVPASYWLDLRGYDPPITAKGVKKPILVLQGERDYQVTMAEFEKWKVALASSRNVTLKSYAQLNHLFVEGTGKSTPSEYDLSGHVAEPVIVDIANWVKNIGPFKKN